VDRPFVIEVVSLFLKKHGLIQRPKVTVVSGTHAQLTERLRFRELDAVVTPMAMIEPELENLARIEVPVVLTCSSRWKTRTNSKNLKAAAAIREIVGGENAQWVMPSSRFKLRAEIDRFVEANQLRGRIVFESDVIASLVRSVIDEIGLSFLPVIYAAREIREKSIRVIGPKDGYWKYRVWLTCHAQSRKDSLIMALAQSFEEIRELAVRNPAASRRKAPQRSRSANP
jgi:DNA-binding transcriptional LysR family regulator